MGHHEHEQMAQDSLAVGVMTFSDTRDEKTDRSGLLLKKLLIGGGHKVIAYEVVTEDQSLMRSRLAEWFDNTDLDAIITNGGTGLTTRDVTIEVARSFFDKELDGFGEIFRYISFQQIGAAAMLSRASAGRVGNKALICLPGSSKAVKLAAERIILPQLAHILWEIRRQ